MADARMVPETPLEWALGVWAFLVELTIVVGAGLVAFRLARRFGSAGAWLAAVAAVAAVGVLWAIWMAPTADHRLPLWPRVAVACVLVLVVAVGLWRTGSPLTGGAFAVVGVLGMMIAQPGLDG